MTSAVHATTAAVSVMIWEPEMLSDIFEMIVGTLLGSTGGVTFVAWGPAGSGDINTGIGGTCTGWIFVDCFSVVAPAIVLGDILGTWGNADVVEVGLPIPVTEHLTPLPFLSFELLADLVLANFLWLPLGKPDILPFGTCALEWVICVAHIL